MTLTIACCGSTATIDPPVAAQAVCLEDPADVAAWLRSLAPRALCGRAHEPGDCPLARYLAARSGARGDISVGTMTYRVGEHDALLPHWARFFVRGVDSVPGLRARGLGPFITAEEALEVLADVVAAEEER